jgi:hypothetical protein
MVGSGHPSMDRARISGLASLCHRKNRRATEKLIRFRIGIQALDSAIGAGYFSVRPSPHAPRCGTLAHMGSKDKGRKEVKKAPKPKPKPEPAQRREGFTPAPPK